MTVSISGRVSRSTHMPLGTRFASALLGGTMLAGVPFAAIAQDSAPVADTAAQDAAQPAPAPLIAQTQTIRSLSVIGAQRLEPQTIVSYIRLSPGEPYTQAAADQAIKDLYATELFSSATVRNDGGNVVIEVVENPVVNRIILEGNKRLKKDKITPEIKLAPRQIYTRSKVRADTQRIIELYKRQGRFAATVEPKTVQLSQNRVDIVYEISEGPKSKVRQINIIGNEVFSDGKLRGEMVTKQARLTSFFSSNTSYDPDRLAFDQQKLRQFYLTQGYADFRVVSAVAELTPDKRDFIITYVVEEGQRYNFGEVNVESQLRDFSDERMSANLPMKTGDPYNAKLVEDTVEQLTELAGAFGYAFADVEPQFRRNKDALEMNITFALKEAPRVYVERIDVNGNTLSQDKVMRREFRLSEGDAFNSIAVKRSTNRIKSLGYLPGKLRDRAEAGQPARPHHPGSECGRTADRRIAALGRFLLHRELHPGRLHPPAQFPRARPDHRGQRQLFALLALGAVELQRTLCVRPQYPGRCGYLPAGFQQLQPVQQRSQHDIQADHDRRFAPPRCAAVRIYVAAGQLHAEFRRGYAGRPVLLRPGRRRRGGMRRQPLPVRSDRLADQFDPRRDAGL